MNGLSVVIPSRTRSNVLPCIEAVRKNDPDVRIIVVDDGIEWDVREIIGLNLMVLCGEKPFCFARNCNIGIAAADNNDVILLNDDAILATSGGFSEMQRQCSSEFGLASAATNLAGNPQQQRMTNGGKALRKVIPLSGHSAPVVAFVCVFIPRRTIERVGLLDERFGGERNGKRVYGFDDNDFCRRVHEAGLLIGVCDGCYVDHGSLVSTFRGGPKKAGDISEAWAIYLEKWGKL